MKQINLLNKLLVLIAAFTGFSINSYALVGNYTVGGTSPNYATLKDAITAVNLLGVTGHTNFLIRSGTYTGSDWRGELAEITGASATARVTFMAESGNPADVTIDVAGISGSNYIVRFNKASYITFKNLTFKNTNTSNGRIFDFVSTASNDSVINCTFTGAKSTSSSDACAVIFASGHTGSNNVFYKNVINDGSAAAWFRGTGSSTWTREAKFIENTINMTNSGYYGIYTYYSSDIKIIKNTINYTGSSSFYGLYCYYSENGLLLSENVLNLSSTSTLYGLYLYYINYYGSNGGFSGNGPVYEKNVINTTNTSGTTYPLYTYYNHYMRIVDNVFNSTSTTGSINYSRALLYYCRESRAEGNKINATATGSGSISGTMFYTGGNTWPDTMQKNEFSLTTTTGGIDIYAVQYGGSGSGSINNNLFNFNSTGGSQYLRVYYGMGIEFTKNKISQKSTTGNCYGMYVNGTTSYQGVKAFNNDIELVSTGSSSHHGLYGTAMNGDKIYNNIFTSKTQGPSNLAYFTGTQYTGARVYNNTFHSLESSLTATNNYGLYNSSTSGEVAFVNNIVSRSTALTTGGYGVYNTGSSLKSDYNLYDLPGGTMFHQSASNSGASLQTFRTAAKVDYNSLVYKAPYVNAANRNFAIDASSQDAWAVNGRGIHDSTRYTDRAGAPVPLFVTTGVPDIGAYEVSPTSTPPDAVATPANPVANSFQVFTFGQDTVLAINWGATVPATYTVKQYTGIKATPVPTGLKRMFFYIDGTPSTVNHDYMAYPFYKNPWIGDIPTENDAVMARKSGAGGWVGYNYTNAQRDINRNIVSSVNPIDSAGSFTVVENGRIGIRCVYPPTGIRISNITAVSADFTWDAIFNPLGYQVIVKTTNTPPTAADWAAGANPTSNSVTVPNLTEDTKYYVFVRNICDVKDTSGHTMDSFQTIITCHAPTIKVVDVEKTRAIVYWDSVKTAIAYEWALTTTSTPPAAGTAVNKLEQMLPYLDQGKQYYIHVRANCNTMYARSDWSTAEFNTWAVGIQDVNMAGKGIHIYPNPVKEELVVMLNGDVKSGSLTVVDMTGKQLQSSSVSSKEVTLNVNALPAGVYILQYADEGRREQMKFTKQ